MNVAIQVAQTMAVGPLRRIPLSVFRTMLLALSGVVMYVASGRLGDLHMRYLNWPYCPGRPCRLDPSICMDIF